MTRSDATKPKRDRGVRGQSRLDRSAVGERIAQARTDVAGLTQKQLADVLGVTGRAVQNWEAGTRAPIRHLRELEEALGVSREWLLWGTQEPPASELAHVAERLNVLEEALAQLTQVFDLTLAALSDNQLDVAELRERLPRFRDRRAERRST
jgi:transcriptional regulator with XRE-family HTH domain